MALVAVTDPGTNPDNPSVPERKGQALLGWIAEPDVRSLYYAAPLTSPATIDEFIAAWMTRRGTRPSAPAVVPGTQVSPLPDALSGPADTLVTTDQFRTHYLPFGAQFAVVRLSELITPQWWADFQYIEELTARVPAVDDLEGLFSFSFTEAELAPPALIGGNAAAFSSARRDLAGISTLRVARRSPTKVTLEFDVTPRPNWVWIAAIAGMPRPLILNGVHHLLALYRAGRQEAYALVRPVQSLQELSAMLNNFQDPGMFKPDQLLAPSPPLLRHYLDAAIAYPVNQRAMDQYLRTVVQADGGFIPRTA
jgi:hypothetical protein